MTWDYKLEDMHRDFAVWFWDSTDEYRGYYWMPPDEELRGPYSTVAETWADIDAYLEPGDGNGAAALGGLGLLVLLYLIFIRGSK